MKAFDWSGLDEALSAFGRQHGGGYRVLELWLDTTGGTVAPGPSVHLAFHAFNPTRDLDAAIEAAAANDDPDELYSAYGARTEQTWFELARVDPTLASWAGLRQHGGGEALVSGHLTALVSRGAADLARFERIFLHPVDDLSDVTWIKR